MITSEDVDVDKVRRGWTMVKTSELTDEIRKIPIMSNFKWLKNPLGL